MEAFSNESESSVVDADLVTTEEITTKTSQYLEDVIANFLYAVPSILLLIFGSFGNILSFLVFNKNTMKQSVTSVYFRVLAITDTIVLFFGAIVFFLIGVFGKDIRLYSNVSCKVFVAVLKVACYHSCWVLVLISVDRFIGVYVPHKYRQYCTKKQAVVSMIILLLFIIAFVGGFWGTALAIDNNVCGIGRNYLYFFIEIYQWLDLGLLNLIPSIILVIVNIAIIIKISIGSFWVDGSRSTGTKASQKANSLTVILLSISLVYILCTIPTSTAFLVIRTFKGPRKHAQTELYLHSCQTLYLANHAVNFLLYCIHGTSFRKELKELFCKSSASSTSLTNSTSVSAYTVSVTDNEA